MKNRIYKSLFLGISSAVAASASYALIAPGNNVNSADIDAFTNTPILIAPSSTLTNPTLSEPGLSSAVSEFKSIEHVIQSGESLSSIFSKLNLSKSDLYQIINANDAGKEFVAIASGKTLQVKTNNT
ncbi:MAG: LysM-like peptidoglycan-binding domain-containing protein [Gammaproteobacteria bacterium]